MGGLGSGRHWHWNAKATTDNYRSVDVRRWAREGYLQDGNSFGWQWTIDGEKVASIQVKVGIDSLRLIYRSRASGEAWEDMDYPVRLLSQPCNFGGHRKWFECPARGCGRRVAILFGGRVFACRSCYQLAYPSSREIGFQRYQRRADRIRERLGWEPGFEKSLGEKPNGMHWRTFHRLTVELEYWEHRSNVAFTNYFTQRFGSLDPMDV